MNINKNVILKPFLFKITYADGREQLMVESFESESAASLRVREILESRPELRGVEARALKDNEAPLNKTPLEGAENK